MKGIGALAVWLACSACASSLPVPLPGDHLAINQLQFVGSHNSYKQAMSADQFAALRARNPQAAASLEYAHLPLAEQLDLGLRKLEIDLFNDAVSGDFPVGHVQLIDMNSHCATLADCLDQIRQWSDAHPRHVPLWISFNAKDDVIAGLPHPQPFDAAAFERLDRALEQQLGDRLIRPADVVGLRWPTLGQARGRVLLILDERGRKRDIYWRGWADRPMFTNAPADHPAAAIMVINDPVADGALIHRMVSAGYMVRTRADADTVEARTGHVARRDAAFASGAQAVSTDYYQQNNPFDTPYQVTPILRCNPVTAPIVSGQSCTVTE